MQSLSNVIKKTNVVNLGNKEVISLYFNNVIEEKINPEELENENDNTNSNSVIQDAVREAERIIENSRLDAENAYKAAFEKGYREGFKKGAEDVAIEAEKRNKTAMEKIEAIYGKAVSEYNKYLSEKENEIKKLIGKISKNVLKRELDFSDFFNEIIIDALNQEQGSKVIVRCNEKYCNSIRNRVDIWKRETGSNLDVFIIEDITISDKSVILVKDEGRSILDMDKVIENIGKIILGES
ncbi:MAG: hypothetical protein LIR50_02060 [Bacillota bacterium]|nr:hypothetical protein [Bacillota bacterium]